MKPAALKARPASADIKRRPVPATSREWDSTVNDLGEYRLSEKQLQAKVQARHASSKVSLWSQDFNFPFSRASHSPQIDYNPLAELQKWEEIQRKEDASFSSAGRRCFTPPLPRLAYQSTPAPPVLTHPWLASGLPQPSASSRGAPPPTRWIASGTRQVSSTHAPQSNSRICHVA